MPTIACRCGKTVRFREELAGQSRPCPNCGSSLLLPVESGPAETAAPQPTPPLASSEVRTLEHLALDQPARPAAETFSLTTEWKPYEFSESVVRGARGLAVISIVVCFPGVFPLWWFLGETAGLWTVFACLTSFVFGVVLMVLVEIERRVKAGAAASEALVRGMARLLERND